MQKYLDLSNNLDYIKLKEPAKIIKAGGIVVSANISGKPSGTDLKNIMKDFDKTVDYFIDGGKSKIGLASTIVQVTDGIPHILRQGSISEEQIIKVCTKTVP